jgi:predicted alternative tryptophan synthase beta-subunit
VRFGAGAFFKVRLIVDMVKGNFNQKPFRKAIIETFGAKIITRPSDTTNAGRSFLAMRNRAEARQFEGLMSMIQNGNVLVDVLSFAQ